VFDLFKYLKLAFREKTAELDPLNPEDKLNKLERPKIRKTILKFISVFHPDK